MTYNLTIPSGIWNQVREHLLSDSDEHLAFFLTNLAGQRLLVSDARLYVTEKTDGTARLTYRLPSHTFGAYQVPALDEMAGELDGIVARIVADAGR